MSNSNGIISAPVQVVEDIAYVLGESSGDVGTLCLSGNINPWSAHKPIEFANPWRVTDQKFAELHYGLDAHIRLGSFMQSDHSDFFWEYTKPSTWFRVLDFDGYNHQATPPDLYTYAYPIYINRAAENGRFRITFYDDASEIPILNEAYKTTSQASAVTAALSNWIVVLLIYGGLTTHLYNTGKTLSEFATSGLIDYHEAISGSQVGAHVTIVPALVYPNNQMSVGDNVFSGSFLNNYYFVPLNFTSEMEHSYELEILFFHYLEGMDIGYGVFTKPRTGFNYYTITAVSEPPYHPVGLIAQKNNSGSNTIPFRLRLGIRRGSGSTEKKFYSRSVHEHTITTESTVAPFVWYFPVTSNNYITFSPEFRETEVSTPTSLQDGDVFFLEVTERIGGESVTEDLETYHP